MSQGAPATSAPPVFRIANQPQGTTTGPASLGITTNGSQTRPQAAGTIQLEPWIWVPGTTAKSALQFSSPSGIKPLGRTTRVTATAILPVVTTTDARMPKACQPYPPAENASPLDLSKLRKGLDKKQLPCETQSQNDPEVLDLSMQHSSTSRDETISYVAALDHLSDSEGPLQLHGLEVGSSKSTESDIVEDILPQLLEWRDHRYSTY